jgi:hypothetical protein
MESGIVLSEKKPSSEKVMFMVAFITFYELGENRIPISVTSVSSAHLLNFFLMETFLHF